jgi:predicted ester cyclase
MSLEENKALYRHYVKLLAHPDHLDEVADKDFTAHDLPPHFPKGIEGLRAWRRTVMAAFPDLHSEIQDIIAEGDKVSARLLLSGTHKGDFAGVKPSGRRITVEVFETVRIEDGKLAERWSLFDRDGLLQQLNQEL